VTPEGLLHPNRPILVTGRSCSIQRATPERSEEGRRIMLRRKAKKRGMQAFGYFTAGFWLVLCNTRSSLW